MCTSFFRPVSPFLLVGIVLLAGSACAPSLAQQTQAPRRAETHAVPPWTARQVAALSLSEKVSQLFAVQAYGYYVSEDDPAWRSLVDLVERFGAGGVIFFQGDPLEQVVMTNALQRRARLPLLVSQDMEWGAGMRVERTTTFPRAMAVGASRNPDFAYATGYVTAREARALGVHHLFAPVADVNNNPFNPVINARSYGEDPQLVAAMVRAFVQGVHDGGAIATLKHFPGHGDTAVDSHADLPVLPISPARLDSLELVPFRAAIAQGVGSVMTGHLALPQLEPDVRVPASLSPDVTERLLREQLGFEGLIVTDALNMHGVTKHFSTGEIAVRALEAGADMLLMSEDPYAARAAILEAVGTGRLSEARIDASVRRVLAAKERLGLPQERFVEPAAVMGRVATHAHQAAAAVVAQQGLTLLRNEGPVLPLTPAQRLLVLTLSDGDDASDSAPFVQALRGAGAARLTSRFLGTRARAADFDAALAEVAGHDVVLVPTYVRVRSGTGRINLPEAQQAFLERVVAAGRPVVLLAFGNPYVVMGLTPPAAYVAAYGGSDALQEAAAEALYGQVAFGGRLPITIPGVYPFGAGLTLPQTALRRGLPEEAGLDSRTLARADSLVRARIDAKAFPGAALAVGRGGVLAKLDAYGYATYEARRPVTPQSLFDMASLTKVIATTTAAMLLYEEGRLDLDAPVVRYLPAFGQRGKAHVTIRHLLTHTSGLIPFRPYHQMGLRTRAEVVDAIMADSLVYATGSDMRYSDLGVITLGLVLEQVAGQPLDVFARARIFEPLGMTRTGFRPVGAANVPADSLVVPTEVDAAFRKRLVQGEVHDETAWLLGGVAGHAGLFSTAEDLARFAYMLVHEGQVGGKAFLKPETIRLFTTPAAPGRHTRALGWDTKSPSGYSSAGQRFGPRSFGHTGFTGTSLWIDPDQRLFVILLTNRVHPTRENRQIIEVRAELADLVYEALRTRGGPLLPHPR